MAKRTAFEAGFAGPVGVVPAMRLPFGASGGRRPVNKQLKYISFDGITTTDVNVTLVTATFPFTITGLRWSFTVFQDAGTGQSVLDWAIVKLQDGDAPNAMGRTNGADFYTPEESVLVFGTSVIDNNGETKRFEGTTKTMRKMNQGDELTFIAKGTATDTAAIRGVVQFFEKA